MGVDIRARGLGIGEALLRYALQGEPLPRFLTIDTAAAALRGDSNEPP